MFNYYNLDAIPIILSKFKVKNIIVSGMSDTDVITKIKEYCDETDVSFIGIDLTSSEEGVITDYTLNVLSDFSNYDAIFLNDDPNWYTIFSELNIINKNNDEFPLVFICNNVFPHKKKDSYINPEIIPDEFVHDCNKYLVYEGVPIFDGFYHAIEENSIKNGVSSAIKDFLSKNSSVSIMDIKLINGIIILYYDNSISHIRINNVYDELKFSRVEFDSFSDNIFQKKLLVNHISKFKYDYDEIENMQEKFDSQNVLINEYEHKLSVQNNELNFKDTQILGFDSKLGFKDSQIKNLESKLTNSKNELKIVNDKLNDAYNQIDSLNEEIKINNDNFLTKKKEYDKKLLDLDIEFNSLKNNFIILEKKELELTNQLKKVNNQMNNKNADIQYKNKQLSLKDSELKKNQVELTSIKRLYSNQFSKLDNNDYCISCYEEKISNNQLEINYLRQNNLIKKILSPFAYLYLILKSNPKELTLNFKLYRSLKNSKCFDIGYYLNNNGDIIESNWCKYFSPELHYVCNGFDEKRKFNKKYYNRNSKKKLLDYILNCTD